MKKSCEFTIRMNLDYKTWMEFIDLFVGVISEEEINSMRNEINKEFGK